MARATTESARSVWSPAERRGFAGPLLIDTHIWLWYLDGVSDRMSRDAVSLLRRASTGDGLLVCDISVWEIANKVGNGKLALTLPLAQWLRRAELVPGFGFLALDRWTLLESTELPGEPQGDPADRMLLALARLRQLPLVTADRTMIDYARSVPGSGFSVCDARRATR